MFDKICGSGTISNVHIVHLKRSQMNAKKDVKNYLKNALLLIFTLMLRPVNLFADDVQIKYVGPLNDQEQISGLSDSGRYFAEVVVGFQKDSLIIRHYSSKKQEFVRTAVYRGSSLYVCGVTNDGDVTVLSELDETVTTVSKKGEITSQVVGSECPTISGPKYETSRSKLREALCSVPANARIKTPEGRARIYNIYRTYNKLPGGQLLALVSSDPINVDTVKYATFPAHTILVLISAGKNNKNYCVSSTLTNASGDSSCNLSKSDFSSAFFDTYYLPANSSAAKCSYSLSYSDPSRASYSKIDVKVEWLVGEYEASQSVAHFELQGKSGTSKFSLDTGGCGRIIELKSHNPRMRSQTFAVGDLYCSHV